MWEGKAPFPKMFILSMIGYVFVIVGAQTLAVLGYFSAVATVDALVVILILLGLIFLRLHQGIRFYITNRRIVKIRSFYPWDKTWELPLESLVDVVSKRIGGRGYISFVPSPGHLRIVFAPLEDDPEEVREIALRARSSIAIKQ